MSTVFGTKKGVFFFSLECRICWLTFKFIFRNIPSEVRYPPSPVWGLCESLNLGQAESSHQTSCQPTKLCFLLWFGVWMGVG